MTMSEVTSSPSNIPPTPRTFDPLDAHEVACKLLHETDPNNVELWQEVRLLEHALLAFAQAHIDKLEGENVKLREGEDAGRLDWLQEFLKDGGTISEPDAVSNDWELSKYTENHWPSPSYGVVGRGDYLRAAIDNARKP